MLIAYTKERVIIRYLMPGDKPRNTGFLIHSHVWREQPDNPLPNVEAMKGAICVGNVFNLELLGGVSECPENISTDPALCVGMWSRVCGVSCGLNCAPCSTRLLPAAGMWDSGGKRCG